MCDALNIVFMGGFLYPRGMAGTKRVQHVIDVFKETGDAFVSVVVLRQSGRLNELSGTHRGVRYETIAGEMSRATVALLLPVLYVRTILFLWRNWQKARKNVIYNYGPVTLENLVPLIYARLRGYRIVFDIVEDYDFVGTISNTFVHKVRARVIVGLSAWIERLASGIVVISSHLEKKYRDATREKTPIHYHPISIDFGAFSTPPAVRSGETTYLFYSGSFGKKDGLPVLLDAFDVLADKYRDLRLMLSGNGDGEAMRAFMSRMEASRHKDRIEFKGYLDDDEYYRLLTSADVHCVTRIDTAYAHAGFPFKLGEFLASGKPVIASRVSDVDRLLTDRLNAMLVKPGDVGEIVSAVEYLMADPPAASLIGQRGRELAASRFDHRARGMELVSFIRGL